MGKNKNTMPPDSKSATKYSKCSPRSTLETGVYQDDWFQGMPISHGQYPRRTSPEAKISHPTSRELSPQQSRTGKGCFAHCSHPLALGSSGTSGAFTPFHWAKPSAPGSAGPLVVHHLQLVQGSLYHAGLVPLSLFKVRGIVTQAFWKQLCAHLLQH